MIAALPWKIMNIKFIDRQPATVACLHYVGPYGEPISIFWQNTVFPWLHTNDLLEPPRYGIGYDNPNMQRVFTAMFKRV